MMRGNDIRSGRRRNRGFTLVEMLVTMILLLLLTGLMTVGMNFAVTQQRHSVFYSQASTLKSTIDNALSDPLRYMRQSPDESGNVRWKLIYRDDKANYIFDAAPVLVVGTGESWDSYDAMGTKTQVEGLKGQLYLRGLSPMAGNDGNKYTYIKLLNAGAYGGTGGGNYNADVYVQLVDADGKEVSSLPLAPVALNEETGVSTGIVTIRLRVVSAVDPDMKSGVYTLTYRVSGFDKQDEILYEDA